MTYEEKLTIVINAINEARQFARKGHAVYLRIGTGNGLSRIHLGQLHDILLQLEEDEQIIKIQNIPSSLKSGFEVDIDKIDYFVIDILDGYDKWCSNYLIKNRTSIENLTDTNLNEIYLVLTQIEEQLQIAQSDKFNFGFVGSAYDLEGYDTEDVDGLINGYIRVLDYLKKLSVIKDYSHGTMSVDADITLDIAKFYEILDRVKKRKSQFVTINPIQQEPAEKEQKKTHLSVTYEPKKGVLEINGKSVKLNKDSFRAKLLELLLKDDKNNKKEWSWDEVIEEIQGISDAESLKENKNKFYPACDGLSKFIAQKIGINDLLIYNKSTVSINPKYL